MPSVRGGRGRQSVWLCGNEWHFDKDGNRRIDARRDKHIDQGKEYHNKRGHKTNTLKLDAKFSCLPWANAIA